VVVRISIDVDIPPVEVLNRWLGRDARSLERVATDAVNTYVRNLVEMYLTLPLDHPSRLGASS
jgi:hypothetical protein